MTNTEFTFPIVLTALYKHFGDDTIIKRDEATNPKFETMIAMNMFSCEPTHYITINYLKKCVIITSEADKTTGYYKLDGNTLVKGSSPIDC